MAEEQPTDETDGPREDSDGACAPKCLTAADLRAARDRPRKVVLVELPDMGGAVYVRSLNGLELDRLDDAMVDDKGKYLPDNVRAKVVALCACDAAGKPLFPLTTESVAEIGQMDGPSFVQPVYEAALALNKQRKSDKLAEKKD